MKQLIKLPAVAALVALLAACDGDDGDKQDKELSPLQGWLYSAFIERMYFLERVSVQGGGVAEQGRDDAPRVRVARGEQRRGGQSVRPSGGERSDALGGSRLEHE